MYYTYEENEQKKENTKLGKGDQIMEWKTKSWSKKI